MVIHYKSPDERSLQARNLVGNLRAAGAVAADHCATLVDFLAWFDDPRPHMVTPTTEKDVNGNDVIDADGRVVKRRPTVDEMIAQRRGVLSRLSSGALYQLRYGDTRTGLYQHYKDKDYTGEVIHQSFFIEADQTIDGKPVDCSTPEKLALAEAANMRAVDKTLAVLAAFKLDRLALATVYTGGKSFHTHFVVAAQPCPKKIKLLSGLVGAIAAICYRSEGLVSDTAAQSISQQCRIPCGKVYGRDQRLVDWHQDPSLAGETLHAIDEALRALCPVRYKDDTRSDDAIAHVASLWVAHAIQPFLTWLEEDRACEGEHRGWQKAVRLMLNATPTREWAPVIRGFGEHLQKRSLTREPKAPRTSGGVRKAAESKTKRIFECVPDTITIDPVRGTRHSDTPLHPVMLTHAVRAGYNGTDIGNLPDLSAGTVAAAIAYQQAMHDDVNGKLELARFSVDGTEDRNPSAYTRWDSARGHAIVFDSGTSLAHNLVQPIGRSNWWRTSCTFVKPYTAAWAPTTGGVDFLQMRPGAGKTTAIVAHIKQQLARNADFSAVWVAPNVALTAKVVADLRAEGINAVHYNDLRKQSKKQKLDMDGGKLRPRRGTVLVTTFHSLKHVELRPMSEEARKMALAIAKRSPAAAQFISQDATDLGMLVFDEFGTSVSMMAHVRSNALWKKNDPINCYSKLVELGKKAHNVVLMEATPTTGCIAALRAFAEDIDKPVTAFDITGEAARAGTTREGEQRTVVTLREGVSWGVIEHAVLCAVQAGKRVLVQIPHVQKATGLAEFLRARLAKQKIAEASDVLLVSGNTSSDYDLPALLADNGAGMKQYKVVVATTSLAAGVSFVNVFDENIVFCGPHIAATTTAQAICRDRTCKRITLVRMHDRGGKSTPIGGEKLPKYSDGIPAGYTTWRRAALIDARCARESWHAVSWWLEEEGFSIITGEDSLKNIADHAPIGLDLTRRSKRLGELHNLRAHFLRRSSEVLASVLALGKSQASIAASEHTEGKHDDKACIADAAVARLHHLASPLGADATRPLAGLAHAASTVYAYLRNEGKTSNVFNAEAGWRMAARVLSRGGTVESADELSWLSGMHLFEYITRRRYMDLASSIGAAVQQAVGDPDLHTDEHEGFVIFSFPTDYAHNALDALSEAHFEYNDSSEHAKLQKWLHATGFKTTNKAYYLKQLLKHLLGVNCTIHTSKKENRTFVSLAPGPLMVAGSIILASMVHTPGNQDLRFMDDTLFDYANGTPAVLPMPDELRRPHAVDHKRINLQPWQQRISKLKLHYGAWDKVTRHSVYEMYVSDIPRKRTWASATPRTLETSKLKKRKKTGANSIQVGEVTAQPIIHPSLEHTGKIRHAALRPHVNVFDVMVGDWVAECALSAEDYLKRLEQDQKFTNRVKENRNFGRKRKRELLEFVPLDL